MSQEAVTRDLLDRYARLEAIVRDLKIKQANYRGDTAPKLAGGGGGGGGPKGVSMNFTAPNIQYGALQPVTSTNVQIRNFGGANWIQSSPSEYKPTHVVGNDTFMGHMFINAYCATYVNAKDRLFKLETISQSPYWYPIGTFIPKEFAWNTPINSSISELIAVDQWSKIQMQAGTTYADGTAIASINEGIHTLKVDILILELLKL